MFFLETKIYLKDYNNNIQHLSIPQPENVILIGSIPATKQRAISPPEEASNIVSNRYKIFKMARFELDYFQENIQLNINQCWMDGKNQITLTG